MSDNHSNSFQVAVRMADHSGVIARSQFKIGDVLIAYTDGITAAENRDGEFWGEQSLESLLRSRIQETPEQIIKCIRDEVSGSAEWAATERTTSHLW